MDWTGAIWVGGIAVMVLGPVCALLGWAVRRTFVWLSVLAIILIVEAGWWANLALVMSNAGDLGGIIDCYPYCSGTQKASQFVIWKVPLFMAAILVALLELTRRGRRSRRP